MAETFPDPVLGFTEWLPWPASLEDWLGKRRVTVNFLGACQAPKLNSYVLPVPWGVGTVEVVFTEPTCVIVGYGSSPPPVHGLKQPCGLASWFYEMAGTITPGWYTELHRVRGLKLELEPYDEEPLRWLTFHRPLWDGRARHLASVAWFTVEGEPTAIRQWVDFILDHSVDPRRKRIHLLPPHFNSVRRCEEESGHWWLNRCHDRAIQGRVTIDRTGAGTIVLAVLEEEGSDLSVDTPLYARFFVQGRYVLTRAARLKLRWASNGNPEFSHALRFTGRLEVPDPPATDQPVTVRISTSFDYRHEYKEVIVPPSGRETVTL